MQHCGAAFDSFTAAMYGLSSVNVRARVQACVSNRETDLSVLCAELLHNLAEIHDAWCYRKSVELGIDADGGLRYVMQNTSQYMIDPALAELAIDVLSRVAEFLPPGALDIIATNALRHAAVWCAEGLQVTVLPSGERPAFFVHRA